MFQDYLFDLFLDDVTCESMFAVILENATYKELYLLRYYLSESKPQWFKQGRPRYNTKYYRGDKPNSYNQFTSDFVSEQDRTTYYGKPVTIVKQAPPNVKYQFENDTPQAINENHQVEYSSNLDTERPKYSGFIQSAVPTATPVMTPTAVSLSKRPVLLPSSGNSKIFEQFEKPTTIGVTPTAMTIATSTPTSGDQSVTTEALIESSRATLATTNISENITSAEFHVNQTSGNESIEIRDGSEGQSDLQNEYQLQVDSDGSINEIESSGEIIFDQFDLDPNQIFSSDISGTDDEETVLEQDIDPNPGLADEGSGNNDTSVQTDETDSTTSQTFTTTIFSIIANDSSTKSSAAILPSQRVNELNYNSDNGTNSQLITDNLKADADELQTSEENHANETQTSTKTIATSSEDTQKDTSALLNDESSGNHSDINVDGTDATIEEETNEVPEKDKDQLSSDILDYDSTVISCQDQRNSDSSKKEYFRPVLQCDNDGVIQIEYAYYGRFNSDTCARGKTESNQAWYWPTCGRKFKVRVVFVSYFKKLIYLDIYRT